MTCCCGVLRTDELSWKVEVASPSFGSLIANTASGQNGRIIRPGGNLGIPSRDTEFQTCWLSQISDHVTLMANVKCGGTAGTVPASPISVMLLPREFRYSNIRQQHCLWRFFHYVHDAGPIQLVSLKWSAYAYPLATTLIGSPGIAHVLMLEVSSLRWRVLSRQNVVSTLPHEWPVYEAPSPRFSRQ